MKKRETGLDVVRSVALIFVISVHFFLNNGFYSRTMTSFSMLAAGCFRWLFFTCVPLFLLITGYLRGDDRPSGHYYSGIFRVIISWLLVSLISIVFHIVYYGTEKSVVQWIGDILDYKAANYSWYVEMYIGLFLLLPYINLAFHSLESRKGHVLMLASVCGVVFLPSVLNGWIVGDSTWNLVPNYWTSLYPFAYYVIGCYIRKYRSAPPSWVCLGLTALICVCKGVLTYATAQGQRFGDGLGGGYSDLGVCAASVLLFLGLYRISLPSQRRAGRAAARLFRFAAAVSLDAYLISWVFDCLFYDRFRAEIVPGRYLYFYVTVCVPVIILSVLSAWPVSRLSGKLAGVLRRGLKAE